MTVKTILRIFGLVLALVAPAAGAFTDLDGGEARLEDHLGQGRWTLVMLWASNCPVCNREAPGIQAFHEAHKDADARVLGIALDGEAGRGGAEAFVLNHDLSFPNLLGEFREVAQLYRAQTGERWIGTPSFLLYDRSGKLVAKQVGPLPLDAVERFIASRDGPGAAATR